MTDTVKVLAQNAPSATTRTSIYTASTAGGSVISSLVVCNRTSTATTFRVQICIANAADNNMQYLYYDIPIGGNDSFAAVLGLTMANTDQLYVYAGNANLSFTLYGIEIS